MSRPGGEDSVVLADEETQSESKPLRPTPAKKQQPEEDLDEDEEEDLEYHAETVLTVMKPVSITMIFVVWAVKAITLPGRGSVGALMAYNESSSDSTGTKFLGSLINALIFLAAILATTVLFVILYKYRCLKIIYGWLIMSSLMLLVAFGGMFLFLLLQAYNSPFDWFSFAIIMWNFGVVGIITIFWHGPTRINQAYLILVSSLMAIFFTRLPEWTTFAILGIVSIYDLFAVLCPKGPLKVLVETAQERKEPIPALLYNAAVFFFMADEEMTDTAPPKRAFSAAAAASSSSSSSTTAGGSNNNNNTATRATLPTKPQEPEEESKRKGVKLGLGDFVFYSVLMGRAALYDMSTVFTCFIAIITGLFCTLLLLAIFRKALPALPISIAFGLLFYFLTRMFLQPFIIHMGKMQVFV